jgi:hypothetical protein
MPTAIAFRDSCMIARDIPGHIHGADSKAPRIG